MIKRVVITSVVLYVLGLIQSEEKKRRSEGGKKTVLHLLQLLTHSFEVSESPNYEKVKPISAKTHQHYGQLSHCQCSTRICYLPTRILILVFNVLLICWDHRVVRFFFSVQPFLKRCLMPHWRFFNLQTSKWAECQHPYVCLYSIFHLYCGKTR